MDERLLWTPGDGHEPPAEVVYLPSTDGREGFTQVSPGDLWTYQVDAMGHRHIQPYGEFSKNIGER